MAQIAAHEFGAAAIGVRAVFPAKGYATFVHSEESAIANGGGSDISAQVLECRGAGTGRLDMDARSFEPHRWIGLPATDFKLPAHVLTEPRLQVRQMHAVIGLADAHNLAMNINVGPRTFNPLLRNPSWLLMPNPSKR